MAQQSSPRSRRGVGLASLVGIRPHLLRDPHAEATRPGHEGHRAQGGATRDTSLTRASNGSSRPSTSPLAFRNDHVESYQEAIRRDPQEAWKGKRRRENGGGKNGDTIRTTIRRSEPWTVEGPRAGRGRTGRVPPRGSGSSLRGVLCRPGGLADRDERRGLTSRPKFRAALLRASV